MTCPSAGCLKLVDELEAATCISVLPMLATDLSPDRAKLHWDGAANYVICKPSIRQLLLSFIQSIQRDS